MMALGTVVQLIIQIARAFGLVADDVLAYARKVQPELRTDPLPDAARTMYDARAEALAREAAIHRRYAASVQDAVDMGDMDVLAGAVLITRAGGTDLPRTPDRTGQAVNEDSPEAVEVYG